jgi:hypothetical protein
MMDDQLVRYGKSAAFMASRSDRETWRVLEEARGGVAAATSEGARILKTATSRAGLGDSIMYLLGWRISFIGMGIRHRTFVRLPLQPGL